jgi:predicted aspartyl protease
MPRAPHRPSVRVGVVVTALAFLAACRDPRSAASTSAPADSASGEVAFRWAGPGGAAIAVPARINGSEPVDLIVDTGATLSCVDSSLATELALPEEQALRGTAIGLGGSGAVRLHEVDSLRVGGAVARGISVCAVNLDALRAIGGDVRGLLGLNVLRNFRVTLDFERQVVRFASPEG